jgi:hypothetical protein
VYENRFRRARVTDHPRMTKKNTTVPPSANEDDGLSAPLSKSTDAHYYSRNRND